jgi:hypothetical protein
MLGRTEEGGMQQLVNGAATVALAVAVVTILACLLGWAESRMGGDR